MPRQAPHHKEAFGWFVPPLGAPAHKKNMMPTRTAKAPSHSLGPMCCLVSQIPSGSAITRLIAVRDCTTTNGPRSSAPA